MKSTLKIKSADRNKQKELFFQVNNLSVELQKTVTVVQVRELDKRYTYANPNRGRCTIDCCLNISTHWLTRYNSDYCQSDMICNQHAQMWMQVRDLVSSEEDNKPSVDS